MSDLTELTLDDVRQAVAGGAAAFRVVTRLQPAGGPGDKVFPPTYATGDRTLKYAMESRRIDGKEVPTVLLDSVASQANRMEAALLRGWEEEALPFPVVAVDFTGEEGIEDLDRITSLDAPHRIADALLRDSIDGEGTAFRDTEAGRAFTGATPRNAAAVYRYCPTALVFGVWDSTGPRGGLGSKFQRALVSEIVGVGVVPGAKVGSRLDPAGIQKGVTIFKRADSPSDWTIHEEEALKEKAGPAKFSRKGAEGKGTPSAINHGNVAPTIDAFAGGVTMDHALQTTVLSLPALRRLGFLTTASGKRLEGEPRRAGETAARTALAALALAAISWQRREGYDLRSRCALVPEEPLILELMPADGGPPVKYSLPPKAATTLLRAAAAHAAEHGFPWEREPIALRPAPKLAELIRESRRLASAGQTEEAEA